MQQYYKLGLELGKKNKISNTKIMQLQKYIEVDNVSAAIHLILEMYVSIEEAIPSELGKILVDSVAKNCIVEEEKFLCFVMGIYNSSFN